MGLQLMSADAKVWRVGDGWHGLHDGDCKSTHSEASHRQGDYYLSTVLADIETCMGTKLRWVEQTYPNGEIGLKGYVS